MNAKVHVVFVTIMAAMFIAGCGSRSVRERERVIHEYSGPEVVVSTKVSFSDEANVSESIKNECLIDKNLPLYIKNYADEQGFPISLSTNDQQSSGRVLFLEVAEVRAPPGGVWSGPKSITVKGKLLNDGKLDGTFIDFRWAAGNTSIGVYGNCVILDKAVWAVSQDVVGYLAKPTMDAKLGEY